MAQFSLTLTIEGADVMTDAAQNVLFEAGCDDATFGASDGVQIAEFDREAADFAEAIGSAIRAVESAVPGAIVVQVRREHEVAMPRSRCRLPVRWDHPVARSMGPRRVHVDRPA